MYTDFPSNSRVCPSQLPVFVVGFFVLLCFCCFFGFFGGRGGGLMVLEFTNFSQQSFLARLPTTHLSLHPFNAWKTQGGETKGKCQSVTSVWIKRSVMCESGVWNGSFHGNETASQARPSYTLSTMVIKTMRPPEGPQQRGRQPSSGLPSDWADLGLHQALPYP